MADWPTSLADGQRALSYGATPLNVLGTAIAAPATANTKVVIGTTALTTLIASTDFEASGIVVEIVTGTFIGRVFLDIAIGPALSEVVIIPDIYWSIPILATMGFSTFFPISIPVGSRVSGRIQADGAATIQFAVQLLGTGGLATPSRSVIQTLGAVPLNTQGTVLTLPATTNTLGAWTTIGTTTYPIEEVILDVQTAATTGSDALALVDIGFGSTPTLAIQQLFLVHQTNIKTYGTNFIGPVPLMVPGGTLISARYQTNILWTGATGFPPPELMIYGVS